MVDSYKNLYFAINESYVHTKSKYFAMIINDLKPLSVFANKPSYMFHEFLNMPLALANTMQKTNFSIKDFFSKRGQIPRKL